MSVRKRVTKRPSYREAVKWIAFNDNAGDDRLKPEERRSGEAQARLVDTIAGYISTILVADLFGAEAKDVAFDVARERGADSRELDNGREE